MITVSNGSYGIVLTKGIFDKAGLKHSYWPENR